MIRVIGIFVAACFFCIAALGVVIHLTLDSPSDWSRLRDALEPSKARGSLILAQLERFRTERGRYPERLDELVPNFLSEIPRPTDGEGFFYKRVDEDFVLTFGFWLAKNVDLYPRCGYSSETAEWYVEW